MTAFDPRFTLALGGSAAASLDGVLSASRYVAPEPMQAVFPVAAIRREPSRTAEQLDQLIFGERFAVLERRDGWGFGQAARDGYVGWVRLETLGPQSAAPTHWVSALRTYAFSEASIKSAPVHRLSMNALVRETGREGRFVQVEGSGWIVDRHLSPIGAEAADPADIAGRFLGAPYLWGGRESVGLDCSGLVQQALYAAGLPAPRDSDLQARLGREVAPSELTRGDLVGWPGHIGMMLDGLTLVHANAHHMAVVAEPLADACARIEAATGAAPSAFRRVAQRAPEAREGPESTLREHRETPA